MSALGWGCDGADAKVRGYVKAGYTGRHKGGTGEGRATLTAWWCRGFFVDGCGGTAGMEDRS